MSPKVNKKAFVVYPSLLDALRPLPKADADKVLNAVIDYGITGNYELDNPALELVLLPIIEGIATQKRRYRNIRLVNFIADDFYCRSAGTTDKSKIMASERVRHSLQKIVVDAQREDLTLNNIVQRISLLIQNPDVRRLLSYGHANSITCPEDAEFATSRLWTFILRAAVAEQKMMMEENENG